jgi:hypothetical protein
MLSKKYDAPTSRTKPIRNPLISELIWNDEQPAWVCDRKTGICKQIPEMKED